MTTEKPLSWSQPSEPRTPEQVARGGGFVEEGGRVFRTVIGDLQQARDWAFAAELVNMEQKLSVELVSEEWQGKGYDDYDVSGIDGVHRITVGHGIGRGDVCNVYCAQSCKLGAEWKGSVQATLIYFAATNEHLHALQAELKALPQDVRVQSPYAHFCAGQWHLSADTGREYVSLAAYKQHVRRHVVGDLREVKFAEQGVDYSGFRTEDDGLVPVSVALERELKSQACPSGGDSPFP